LLKGWLLLGTMRPLVVADNVDADASFSAFARI
jgi:hypothetical protein